MDRAQILLVGLPLFLFCTDLLHLFSSPPPPPPTTTTTTTQKSSQPPQHHEPPVASQDFENPSVKTATVGGVGLGNTVNIKFCTSCSYRGNALTVKKMLETAFPGIDVVLANYPPSFPKRLLGKLVPVAQIGVVGLVVAGEQIFPMMGFMTPPSWYNSLRANKFGTIATTWLLGNTLQSFLQSTGAFEVYHNDELVFSKLKEGRFPGEIELKDYIGRKLGNARVTDDLGKFMDLDF